MARMSLTPLLVLSLAWAASATDKTLNSTLDISLAQAPTALDKVALLPSPSDWRFDFFAQPTYQYNPGAVINANAATFPATVGNGLTMSWVNLGPCAMQPPHYHPRASNYIVVIEGTVETYMIPENGGELIKVLLEPGQMTLFPKGSLHSMQNMGCDKATLVSALSTEDPGTHNVANGLFGLPRDMVAAAFGGSLSADDLDTIYGKIPPVGTGVTLGSASCLKTCHMK
ncbi:hypothetical protein JX265_005155 [Neoarthrinium moseri]|uniref:Cupin type-1 domain-containing protein n=1 Tax=Neoarthrinium moseri TaxID=1658444 RepID=A0A9P9WPV5_9PEZI|nr:uncharacterized protein JN550_012328 [Neoarthrinium moseri]KAI1843065.1 hypothetical protein JX266_010754 [Neoarthrinium moseri]KAI1858869.1 hypothetical protein JN550_012328 [Neoarthrinium moseri]KAI1873533.1 hypothetical protein JX265_005155 [Neoarthrinium moseri]